VLIKPTSPRYHASNLLLKGELDYQFCGKKWKSSFVDSA
jgi:hypothetical protein